MTISFQLDLFFHFPSGSRFRIISNGFFGDNGGPGDLQRQLA